MFDLLFHLKGTHFVLCAYTKLSITSYFSYFTAELIGFQMLDPAKVPYVGPAFNISYSQLQRGHFIPSFDDVSRYQPPSLDLYIQFQPKMYLLVFCILHLCQIFCIFVINKKWFDNGSSTWKTMLNSINKAHFPFPNEDWDVPIGNCSDHIKRKGKSQREFYVTSVINLLFNMTLLSPLIILCKFPYFSLSD